MTQLSLLLNNLAKASQRSRAALVVPLLATTLGGYPNGGNSGPQERRSIAAFEGHQWTITSLSRPAVVTRGEWLEETVRAHRDALENAAAVLIIDYEPGSRDLARRVKLLRRASRGPRGCRWLPRTRSNHDATLHSSLIEELSLAKLLPSEIARITGFDLADITRIVGTETEARIARRIHLKAQQRDRAREIDTTTGGSDATDKVKQPTNEAHGVEPGAHDLGSAQ